MHRRALAVTFFAFVWLALAFSAATAYGQTMTTTQVSPQATPKPFSISASIGKTKSLYDFQDGTRVENTELALVPSYKWNKYKTMAIFSYSHDDRYTENSDIGDIPVVTSYQGWTFSRFTLSPSFSFVVPQSKISREFTNLETSLSVRLNGAIRRELLIPGFYFSGGIGVTRSIHRYETAVNGMINNQYSFNQSLATGYEYGIFSIGADFSYTTAWTYAGGSRASFNHSEEGSVAMGNNFSFSLGHTNGGSIFRVNGYESNVKLIDDNNSLVYAKVGMQY